MLRAYHHYILSSTNPPGHTGPVAVDIVVFELPRLGETLESVAAERESLQLNQAEDLMREIRNFVLPARSKDKRWSTDKQMD
jgi:hypothetical protein